LSEQVSAARLLQAFQDIYRPLPGFVAYFPHPLDSATKDSKHVFQSTPDLTMCLNAHKGKIEYTAVESGVDKSTQLRGASLASMATSSPIAVKTMTSVVVSHAFSDHWLVLTGVLLLLTEELVDLFTNLTLWNLDIILGGTVVGHEGEKAVVGDVELAKRLA